MYNKDLLDLYITFTNEVEVKEVIGLLQSGASNDTVLNYLNVGEDMWPHIMSMYSRFESGTSPDELASSFEEAVVLMEETMDESMGMDELTGHLSFGDVDWDDFDAFGTDYE